MKNKLFSFGFLFAMALFIQPSKYSNLNNLNNSVSSENKFCGNQYNFSNMSGYTVTKITVQRTGTTPLEYFNPSFPFSVFDSANGSRTILVTFASGTGSGSFVLTFDWDGSLIACEPFEYPHSSPVAFTTGCNNYNFTITNNEECN